MQESTSGIETYQGPQASSRLHILYLYEYRTIWRGKRKDWRSHDENEAVPANTEPIHDRSKRRRVRFSHFPSSEEGA